MNSGSGAFYEYDIAKDWLLWNTRPNVGFSKIVSLARKNDSYAIRALNRKMDDLTGYSYPWALVPSGFVSPRHSGSHPCSPLLILSFNFFSIPLLHKPLLHRGLPVGAHKMSGGDRERFGRD
jgi:hypothetical protein